MYKGERFNSITHLLGAAAAIAGLVVIVVLASMKGDPWKIVSFSIYGTTLMILYICSTLHHSLRGRASRVFLKLDYLAIYLLIAGSYTPITLVAIRGAWGWSIFGVIWGLAVLGIVIDSLPLKGKRVIPIIIYLLMGWMAMVALVPIRKAMPGWGLGLLLAGGVAYTVGVVFYLMDEKKMPWAHGVWHLFVLTGSAIHYLTMMLYIL
jgi:hemolysin III